MGKNELDLLSELEYAEIRLEEDIQALGYFQDEYFLSETPAEDFRHKYVEMQNALLILYKSMLYNKDQIQEAVNKGYEVKRSQKEVVA